jgi:ABC-type Mn2+/Zn2+ transport system ATPase subunit
VLLFDEPFAGVDIPTATRLLTLMSEMPPGVSSLVVDHDPARLAGLCSRVIQLHSSVRDAE